MATDAPNGTPMPRAVLRISADVERRVKEHKALRAAHEAPPPASETVVDPAPLENPPPAPAPADPPGDPRHADPQYWRNLYLSSEGRLRKSASDLNQLRDQNRQQVAELQAQITALQAASTPAPAPADLTKFFTSEQVERFGEETCRAMVSAAEKAAGETVTKQIEQHVKPLVDARKADATRVAEDAFARFNADLDKLLPADWREIDTQQPWLDWLAQHDTNSGLIRGEILSHHTARRDAPRTAQMMLAYLETQKPPARSAPPAPPVAPNGTGAGGGTHAPSAARTAGVPSGAEITQFYKRAALGQVSDAERVAFEARLPKQRAA